MAKKKKTPQKKRGQQLFKFHIPEGAKGPILLILSFVLLLGMFSFAWGPETRYPLGLFGYAIGWSMTAFFGLNGYFIVALIAWIGWRRLFGNPIPNLFKKGFYFTLSLFCFGMLLSVIESHFILSTLAIRKTFFTMSLEKKLQMHLAGAPLFYLYKDLPTFNLSSSLNVFGVSLIFSSLGIYSLSSLFGFDLKRGLPYLIGLRERFKTSDLKIIKPEERFVKVRVPEHEQKGKADMLAIAPEANLKERPSLSRKEKEELKVTPPKKILIDPTPPPSPAPKEPPQSKREKAISAQKIINGDFAGYKIPSSNFLTSPVKVDQTLLRKDLKRRAEVLEETLLSFGIEAKVGEINCGPTITSFEVHPAIGVKVQKIKSLENDIALNLEAKSIRILAPIPGKAAIGIEVPNPHPQEVSFKEMLTAYQQGGKKFYIPMLLGKTVSGEYVMSDLTKMPHMIIAGATGSGKSVCINTIVMSILMNARPDEIKMIMVDPKKVELTPYTKLPHMLAPVITEPQGACAAMHWLVKEMENRYEILKQVGYRNISSFNSRKINAEFEKSLGKEIPEKLHYIVAIVDELADLMMVSSNDIETYIARIAQMARAVGIHLILATQRPSREVITGLIKANFPTRISFKVASRVNSQIVLDEIGAESLLGNGDMLFLPPGTSHLMRAQGAFIRDEDINATVRSICEQAPPNYVIESFDKMDSLASMQDDGSYTPQDPLYEQALEVVLSTQNASTTFLQRKLKVGYARAASLIDELETQGIIGPADGAKARKILVGEKEE
jgi:S-DNA-T family DNA segregation ATPase FtsK/SpoIIIE